MRHVITELRSWLDVSNLGYGKFFSVLFLSLCLIAWISLGMAIIGLYRSLHHHVVIFESHELYDCENHRACP